MGRSRRPSAIGCSRPDQQQPASSSSGQHREEGLLCDAVAETDAEAARLCCRLCWLIDLLVYLFSLHVGWTSRRVDLEVLSVFVSSAPLPFDAIPIASKRRANIHSSSNDPNAPTTLFTSSFEGVSLSDSQRILPSQRRQRKQPLESSAA